MTPVISLLVAVCLLAAQSGESMFARGVEQFHKGEYAAALATLKEAERLSPADARIRAFRALAGAALGNCANAADELKLHWTQIHDRDIRRLAGLGAVQCLLAAEKYSDLLPILFQLRSEYPGDADLLYESAKVFNKAWNSTLYEMFQKTPASYRVNQLSAEIFETQGRYTEAIGEYRKAIQKNPAALNSHFRLGRAILLESHEPAALADARRQFEAELALNPSDAAAEYEIGQILIAEQKPADAAPHYQKAIDLNPKFPEALVALAKIRAAGKQFASAVELLERAIRLQPRMEAAHYALMLAYRDSGRIEDARREKDELDKLQKPPAGEFTEFLKKLGEQAPKP